MSMLEEIEKAIEEVRARKRLLLRLRSFVDSPIEEEEVMEPPNLVPMIPYFEDQGSFSSSSRMTRSRQPTFFNEECTFKPAISERSRKLAAQVPRDPNYRKSKSQERNFSEKVDKPAISAVTKAIAERIKKTYGSLEEYHKQRRENALSYKEFPTKNDEEECTFQPVVTRVVVKGNAKPVEGLDAFVKRLQAAREKRVRTQEELKPGSGCVYTGEPTKVQPFSFLGRDSDNRARLRE
jgi:hypothetical protein